MTRIQHGGHNKPPVPKKAMHLYLLPEIIAKLHIISQVDDKLIGDLLVNEH